MAKEGTQQCLSLYKYDDDDVMDMGILIGRNSYDSWLAIGYGGIRHCHDNNSMPLVCNSVVSSNDVHIAYIITYIPSVKAL